MNSAVQNTALLRGQICDAIAENQATLSAYLPRHVAASRFIALATRAVIDNPDVWDCSVPSVLRALGAAAASGLPIDGKMSSLIVRKSRSGKPTCTWDPSYRGMCYLALESGHVISVESHAVHAKDDFRVELGSDPKIIHQPYLAGDRGEVIAAYGVAQLKSGGIVREVLGAEDLRKIRNASPAAEKGPWNSWPERMAMKSAMRRLLKRLPAADIGTLERARQHVIEELDDGEGNAFRAAIQPSRQRHPNPEDTAELESRALQAISEAESAAQLADAWSGVRVEFKTAGAEMPLSVEARYHDRREELRQ